jgi:hypothetical protein
MPRRWGGRPASAYLLAPSADGAPATSGEGSTTTSSIGVDILAVNQGTTNFVAKYVNAADVGNSAIWEAGGRVGINTGGGASDYLHVRFDDSFGAFTGLAVQNTNTAPTRRPACGQVGIGTTNPADALHVAGEVRANACVRNAAATQIAARARQTYVQEGHHGIQSRAAITDGLAHVHYLGADEFPQQHFGTQPCLTA